MIAGLGPAGLVVARCGVGTTPHEWSTLIISSTFSIAKVTPPAMAHTTQIRLWYGI